MTEAEWLDIFADNLVNMLDEAKMTQGELAKQTGLSKATISGYIHRRKMPGVKALVNIADVFICSVDELTNFGDVID